MKKSFIVLLVIAFVVFLGYFWVQTKFNSMVVNEESVKTAWSQVENVYQRRADLIPNLVNTVKGYAKHEKETLTEVVEARAKATSINVNADNLNPQAVNNFMAAQDGLSSALSKLMVVVEKYPDLKANQNFLELQSQLEGTENRIATERRRFNEATKTYNIYIKKFPNNIFAGMFGFEQYEYFKAEKGAEKAPEVSFDE